VFKVKEIIRRVSDDLRRDILWKTFSTINSNEQCNMSVHDFFELYNISSKANIYDFDPRISDFFSYHDHGIQLAWDVIFCTMKEETSFSQFITFPSQNFNVHLFYFKRDDLFLILTISEEGYLTAGTVMARNDVSKDRWTRRAMQVINFFINRLLYWIWHDLSLGEF